MWACARPVLRQYKLTQIIYSGNHSRARDISKYDLRQSVFNGGRLGASAKREGRSVSAGTRQADGVHSAGVSPGAIYCYLTPICNNYKLAARTASCCTAYSVSHSRCDVIAGNLTCELVLSNVEKHLLRVAF